MSKTRNARKNAGLRCQQVSQKHVEPLERRCLLSGGLAFGSLATYSTDWSTGVATGDLNGDGRQDIVAPNTHSGDTINVFLNEGGGVFGAPIVVNMSNSTTTVSQPFAAVIADFNGDGKMDIATCNFDGTVSVVFGNGSGTTWSTPQIYQAGSGPDAIIAPALYRSGVAVAPDIYVLNRYDGDITHLINNGFGTFSEDPANPIVMGGSSSGPNGMASGDFFGDNPAPGTNPDLVTANSSSDSLSILLSGSTTPETITLPTGSHPFDVVTGDFNGDGYSDLAFTLSGADEVGVMLSNGPAGTFQPMQTFATGTNPLSLVAGDFNGDGKLDLVVGNQTDGSITPLGGNGDGTFTVNPAVSTGGVLPYSVVATDLNGDGKLDIVAGDYQGTAQIATLFYDGTSSTNSNFASLTNGALSVVGTSGDDTITLTTSGSNLTVNLNGVNSTPFAISSITSIDVEGEAGNDSITLGAGVIGASVQGGPGDDSIIGGPGDDTLGGGQGNDYILGDAGDDLIHGGAGDDSIGGGQGNDQLYGGLGNDTMTGGAGNDALIGGAGNNVMHGGAGDDTIFAINGAADTLYGGAGTDTAHIDQGLDQIPNSDIESVLFT